MASKAFLEQAYLAYFGRPVDVTGAHDFANSSEGDVENAFFASVESKALYGDAFGNAQINAIYNMLFNRDAEPAGLAFWSNEVARGALTPAGTALGILAGAKNADATAIANKLLASAAFTAALDTPAEINSYSGALAAANAVNFLKSVSTTLPTQSVINAAVLGIGGSGSVAIVPKPSEDATLTLSSNTVAENDRGATIGDKPLILN